MKTLVLNKQKFNLDFQNDSKKYYSLEYIHSMGNRIFFTAIGESEETTIIKDVRFYANGDAFIALDNGQKMIIGKLEEN